MNLQERAERYAEAFRPLLSVTPYAEAMALSVIYLGPNRIREVVVAVDRDGDRVPVLYPEVESDYPNPDVEPWSEFFAERKAPPLSGIEIMMTTDGTVGVAYQPNVEQPRSQRFTVIQGGQE